MALVKDYLEKTNLYQKEYGEKTIVLMQVGAFFEVYGLENKNPGELGWSQICDFTRLCDLNIADKKTCVGKDNVLMAGFSTYMIEKYLKKLQEAGYTAVVFTQDENNKTVRSLAGIYSPGTYFSNESTSISNNTCCIWVHVTTGLKDNANIKRVYIGVANINIYTGKTAIFEFNENYILNPTTFDELERFISIYKPSEVIINGNIDDKEIDKIINYANISCNSIHKLSLLNRECINVKRALNTEKQTYQKELLNRFFKIADFDSFCQNFYENAIATQAFCFLLDFIYQHNPSLTHKISEPIFENCSDRLILANHSLKQLNIIEDEHGNGNKFSSVEKILNICITSMGKRHFSHHFLNPTTDIKFLEQEYNITEYILNNYQNYEFLRAKLGTMKDLSRMNRYIIMKKISPKMLHQLYQNLFTLKEILVDSPINTSVTFSDYLCQRVDRFYEVLPYADCLIEFCESNFCMDQCPNIDISQQFETNFIRRGVDKELDEKTCLYMESMDQLEAIRLYLNSCISKYEKNSKTTDYIKLHETEKNNFKLLATKRRCVLLKKQEIFINSITYISSYDKKEKLLDFNLSASDLVFHTQTASNDSIACPQINQLCKNISNVKIQMKEILTRIYLQLLSKLSEFQNQFETLIQFVTMVDITFAKATIAKKYNYCKPTLIQEENSFVDVKNLRHCLIEHIQQNEVYVTNDISLGRGLSDGILLYGTNAVGKTSLIRALGIAVIMAQSGLYVPCSAFTLSPYKYIFTRIIGNDNIFKGLSTFMVEMYELRTILRLADNKSLVLGDELCSGTESISAQSIFVAGIMDLFKKKSSFIFATHLHEIIKYDEFNSMPSVHMKHMSVIYDKQNAKLVYDRKLKDGPGGNMYGLEVCRSLNMPDDFLQTANNIRMKYHYESSDILSLKTSHFNSQKIIGKCEICNIDMGTEVHHLQQQRDANNEGFINNEVGNFHKNHLGNLLTVCEKCHHTIHKKSNSSFSSNKQKKVKTTNGFELRG